MLRRVAAVEEAVDGALASAAGSSRPGAALLDHRDTLAAALGAAITAANDATAASRVAAQFTGRRARTAAV